MADRNVSSQAAALELMYLIGWSEGKNLNVNGGNDRAPKRDWIIMTYAQCLFAVQDPGNANLALQFQIPE